jgi:hypothetical protein
MTVKPRTRPQSAGAGAICLEDGIVVDEREEPAMTEPYEPPRPRDDALQEELDALHEQEREGHSTPQEQRRAEQLERRLRVDEHGAEVRARREQDHEADRQDEEERARHRR